nr:glycosyltransferase [Vibrio antiquarius]
MIERVRKEFGCEFVVYLTSGEGGILEDEYKKIATVVIRDLNKPLLYDYLFNLKKHKPDTIHINANLASGIYCFLAKLVGFKNCFSQIRTSSDYSTSLSYRVKKPLFKFFTNKFSRKVIGVCNSVNNLTQTPSEKWITVYNGFHSPVVSESKNYKNNTIKLVMVGRLHQVKNHEYAFKVLAKLNNITDAKLYIYGDGEIEYKNRLLDYVNKYNVQSDVIFCGETKTPQITISKYDVLLLTSTREGLPGVVIEAMSVGVPAICSNLDGCLEISNYSSSVNCLPISDDKIANWCSWILNVKNKSNTHDTIRDFKLSPFNIDNHCKKIYKVWTS